MQNRKPCMVLVAVALVTCWAANAQEFAYDNMIGGRVSSPAPLSVPVLAYGGGDQQATFRPRSLFRPRSSQSQAAAYCVRACDGRYFPAPAVAKKSLTEGCKNLCPASETQVFYGRSIDGAYSQKGQAYSALGNAFRYRKELVAGCTCNGKDMVGLARIKPEDDGTLRQGDMLASAEGMKVVRRIVDGEPQLAATSNPISSLSR
jgi:hypothetical protein